MPSPVVAVFNTSEDTTDLLRVTFERAGFAVVTAFTHRLRDGQTDLEAFMRLHQPRVVVYDIAVPYEQNWRLYERIRDHPVCRSTQFVLTTLNIAHVQEVAGREQRIYEIVGKPYDLDVLIRAVKEALRARPTS